MKILSVDPSIVNIGVAILDDRKLLKSYTFRTNAEDELAVRVKQISDHFSGYTDYFDIALIEYPGTFMRKGQYAIKNVKSVQLLMLSIGVIAGVMSQRCPVDMVGVNDWKGRSGKSQTKLIVKSLC